MKTPKALAAFTVLFFISLAALTRPACADENLTIDRPLVVHGSLTVRGSLTVTGPISVLGGGVSIGVHAETPPIQAVRITEGPMSVAGALTVKGSLTVDGPLYVFGSISGGGSM